MDDHSETIQGSIVDSTELSKFTESYASFNRIINSLQRKYIDLKEDFSAQNQQLAEANKKLVELTRRNLSATRFLNGLLNSLSVGENVALPLEMHSFQSRRFDHSRYPSERTA